MTKFEAVGVDRQIVSATKEEAMTNFSHSCKVCCFHGMRIDCDKCAIALVNAEVIAYFDDIQKPQMAAK